MAQEPKWRVEDAASLEAARKTFTDENILGLLVPGCYGDSDMAIREITDQLHNAGVSEENPNDMFTKAIRVKQQGDKRYDLLIGFKPGSKVNTKDLLDFADHNDMQVVGKINLPNQVNEGKEELIDAMLKAVSKSTNKNCAELARRIIDKETTIENELQYAGSFMTSVLKGDLEKALESADGSNKRALEQNIKELKSLTESAKVIAKYVGDDPDTSNMYYKGDDGVLYVAIDGAMYTMTEEMEPDCPVHNVEIAVGEPVYDPDDKFGRQAEREGKRWPYQYSWKQKRFSAYGPVDENKPNNMSNKIELFENKKNLRVKTSDKNHKMVTRIMDLNKVECSVETGSSSNRTVIKFADAAAYDKGVKLLRAVNTPLNEMNTFDVKKRQIMSFEDFHKNGTMDEDNLKILKGRTGITKDAMSGEEQGKKGYATLGDPKRINIKESEDFEKLSDEEVDQKYLEAISDDENSTESNQLKKEMEKRNLL